jgi:hypothetical protein
MTEKSNLWSGGWWRFDKYEIRDGWIGPAPNATLEWYDPWEAYHRSRLETGVAPPYQHLLDLALSLGAEWDSELGWILDQDLLERDFESQKHELLLDWCNRFRLLGILPHSASRIDLPLRFVEPRTDVIAVRRFIRSNGKWVASERYWRLVGFPTDDMDALGAMIKEGDPPLGNLVATDNPEYEEPRVFFQGLAPCSPPTSRLYDAPLATVLDAYFPDSRDEGAAFECPRPLSPGFWNKYREPVCEFLGYAVSFLNSVEPVASRRVGASLYGLELLIEPAGVSLSHGRERAIEEKWTCPSLVSSLARMAIQDAAAGRRLGRCECGQTFLTDRDQALYCSTACGWRYRKSRARKKSKPGCTENPNGKETRKQ